MNDLLLLMVVVVHQEVLTLGLMKMMYDENVLSVEQMYSFLYLSTN
jgi:hypothetical protein